MSAGDVARAMADGVRRSLPTVDLRLTPLSDGGPGLLDSLRAAGEEAGRDGGSVLRTAVQDPLGREVEARLMLLAGADEGIGVAESADACGLHLLAPSERRPSEAGTEGVGGLIRFAAERGLTRLILGLGGSGTCDGGAGAARRLGWRFLDEQARPLDRGGGPLVRLATIRPPDVEPELPEIRVLADVENPLLGPRGAARTFAPQKGAGPDEVRRLEAGLERLASLSPAPDLKDHAGAGAAGGLAFGCAAFLEARIQSGSSWVLDRVGLEEKLEWSELVVTGEGAFDETSGMGKVTDAVLRRARSAGVKAVLACGRIEGRVPGGVIAGDGGGDELDAEGLSGLVARLVDRLAGERPGRATCK